jgi:hypothetical protein
MLTSTGFSTSTPAPSPSPATSRLSSLTQAPASLASTSSIPSSVKEIAEYIDSLPKKKKDGLPSRNKLRKDDRLRGEVNRKTGLLRIEKRSSKLRPWKGDERLFSKKVWDWLCQDETDEPDDEEFARRLQREEMGLRKQRSLQRE